MRNAITCKVSIHDAEMHVLPIDGESSEEYERRARDARGKMFYQLVMCDEGKQKHTALVSPMMPFEDSRRALGAVLNAASATLFTSE